MFQERRAGDEGRSMHFHTRALIEAALDEIGDDQLVLSVLLLMRDPTFQLTIRQLAAGREGPDPGPASPPQNDNRASPRGGAG